MNTQLKVYTRPRCSLLPPNTASGVCDCERTLLICSQLPNPAFWVCDCDRTSLICSHVHSCPQTLLPGSLTVTELHWYVHCCDEHATKNMHSQMENSRTFIVFRPKGRSWDQTVMNTQRMIYTVKWRTHWYSLSWGLKDDHEVKLWWTHNEWYTQSNGELIDIHCLD